MTRTIATLITPLLLALGACSGEDTPQTADADTASQATQTPADDRVTATEAGDDSGAAGAAGGSGSGGITLRIGAETWEFDNALCAYTNAPAGEPGSEWNVSSTKDDYQVYVNEDSFGPRVSIADVIDFGSMEWVSEGNAVTLTVDGNDITAEGTFTDLNGDQQDGTLSATCPSWVEG